MRPEDLEEAPTGAGAILGGAILGATERPMMSS